MRFRLKEARKAKKYTQLELAQAVGLSPQFICDLEKGRSAGSVRTWDALQQVLDVDQHLLREMQS